MDMSKAIKAVRAMDRALPMLLRDGEHLVRVRASEVEDGRFDLDLTVRNSEGQTETLHFRATLDDHCRRLYVS